MPQNIGVPGWAAQVNYDFFLYRPLAVLETRVLVAGDSQRPLLEAL